MTAPTAPADLRPTILADELRDALRGPDPIGDRFSNHVILGNVDLDSVAHAHKVVIHNSRFTGRFYAEDAHFARTLDLTGCTFEQGLNLEGAHIEGELWLERTTARGNAGSDAAVNLDQAHIDRNLRLFRSTVEGSFRGSGTHVGGQTFFIGVRITGKLHLKNIDLKQDLYCTPADGELRTEVVGDVLLNGAKVGGLVMLNGVLVGGALLMRNARIGADLLCEPVNEHRMTVVRLALLEGMKVAGRVSFDGARFENELDLRNAELSGNFHARPANGMRTEVLGTLSMNEVKVAGEVAFNGAMIQGPAIFSGSEFKSGLLCLPDGPYRTEMRSGASMMAAKVGSARIDGGCCPGAPLDLSWATFTQLEFHQQLPAQLLADGLRYQELTLPNKRYLDLLEATQTYRKSTYQFLETHLRNQGEDDLARKVYVAMRRGDRARGGMNWRGQCWDWFLDMAVRYGTETYRLLFRYFLPAVVLGWIVFSGANAIERKTAGPPPTWADAFWLSVQTNMPMFPVLPARDLSPSGHAITFWDVPLQVSLFGATFGITYNGFATVLSLASYVIVPLFIASLSGLLKREK